MNGYQSIKCTRQMARTFFKNISNSGEAVPKGMKENTFAAGRNGGEELAIWLPRTAGAMANVSIAERLKDGRTERCGATPG